MHCLEGRRGKNPIRGRPIRFILKGERTGKLPSSRALSPPLPDN